MTAFVDNCDISYLCTCLSPWQTACWSARPWYLELSGNGMLNYANTLPSGGDGVVILETCLCHSHAILAKVFMFTHTVHIFHMSSVRSRARGKLIGYWMETDQRMSNLLIKIRWTYPDQLKLEYLSIVLKSCLTFELECTWPFLVIMEECRVGPGGRGGGESIMQ